MRAVFLSYFHDLAFGGQKNLLALVSALHGTTIDARVVVPRHGAMSEALTERGIPVDCVEICYPARGMRGDALRGAWALRRVLAARDCDLIYVDGPDQVLPAALAAFGRPTRVLWHVQMSMESLFDRDNVRLADAMVFCSPVLSERFAAYPMTATTHTVLNSVDCERFAPDGPRVGHEALDLPGDTQLLVCVGEVAERKGSFDLIAAMERVDNPRARLAFVGRASPEVETQMRQAIAAAGLDDRVRLLGYRDDIPALLRTAALLVMPSPSEGMSLALLEAMATGVPIVASDIAANRVLIEPGRGLTYPVGDASALARAIEALLNAPEQAVALAAEARRHVLAHHQREAFVRDFASVMQRTSSLPRQPVFDNARDLVAAWRRRPRYEASK